MDVKLKIKTMVETTQDLPAMPQVWLKIRELTQQPDVAVRTIANEILKDQSMTTRLLKAANSSKYVSYRKHITTVTDAVMVLGFSEVRNVVIGYAFYKMMDQLNKNKQFDFKAFWMHSLTTGAAARMIAENVQYVSTEEAFVAGLLHDIGKLVIGQLMLQEYEAVQALMNNGMQDIEAEQEIFHVDHQEIGRWVAERWYFPELLVHVISQHHRTELEDREKSLFRLVDIISVANDMAHLIVLENKQELMKRIYACHHKSFYLFGLSKDRCLDIVRELPALMRKEMADFGSANIQMSELESLVI
ncbi:MAG: HDOD domain-containing protein [Calditrichaeota bacterium]|nr:MAG: HDOD domain-containing protein [Calditrichota bacterium]